MSFSCPHFDINRDTCTRVHAECVPGRKGCVLQHNSKFAVPIEQRVESKQAGSVPKPAAPLPRKGLKKLKKS